MKRNSRKMLIKINLKPLQKIRILIIQIKKQIKTKICNNKKLQTVKMKAKKYKINGSTTSKICMNNLKQN